MQLQTASNMRTHTKKESNIHISPDNWGCATVYSTDFWNVDIKLDGKFSFPKIQYIIITRIMIIT